MSEATRLIVGPSFSSVTVMVTSMEGGSTEGVRRDDRHHVGGLRLVVQLRPGPDRDLPLGGQAELMSKEDASGPPNV